MGNGNARWWGSFSIPEGEERLWQIGPLTLGVYRSQTEWRITYLRGKDPLEATLEIDSPSLLQETDDVQVNRYGFRKTTATLQLMPHLANRPLVVFTEMPFYLPPGENAVLFISVPLWVQILVDSKELFEIPVFRPSDTWFGPSTMEGELAYSGRTAARLNLENLPVRPHRAICSVRVVNRADSKLHLEKMKLPMLNLSLFEAPNHQLWTELVTLERQQDGSMASLKLGKSPAAGAAGARLLVKPREKAESGGLTRAFAGIFRPEADND